MKKSSQIRPVGATASPEQVTVAMAEIAESVQEGLLALAVGAGVQVMQALMDADVTALAGAKGRHDQALDRGTPRPSARLGHPRWAPGSGHPASGTRRRRLRGVVGSVV